MSQATHPMILVAAASVTIASVVAIASITGHLPGHSDAAMALTAETTKLSAPAAPASAQIPAETATVAKAAAPTPKRIEKPVGANKASSHTESTPALIKTVHNPDEARRIEGKTAGNAAGIDVIDASPARATEPTCVDCGTIQSVQAVKAPGEGSALGVIAGGVVGGLLGNQIGKGSGKTVATIASALGGAWAGHEVEKKVRSQTRYEVVVRHDDGSTQQVTVDRADAWRTGDRVRVDNGRLLALEH